MIPIHRNSDSTKPTNAINKFIPIATVIVGFIACLIIILVELEHMNSLNESKIQCESSCVQKTILVECCYCQ